MIVVKVNKPRRSASQPAMTSRVTEDFHREVDAFESNKSTYIIALNASRLRKKSSVFESKVKRELLSHADKERVKNPGPGYYSLPSDFATNKGGQSSFLSSEERFRNVCFNF